MPNYVSRPSGKFIMGVVLSFLVLLAGCQPQSATNTSTNNNAIGANTTANNDPSMTSNANATSDAPGTAIETREPEQYSATITLKLEMTGTRNISTPPLSADFARDGTNRRISVKLPGSDQVIYLDRGDKRYVILPNRKQYAEIDTKSTGFEVPSVMTPSQIVNQAKSARGCEKLGEETSGGRASTKYRCAGSTKTGTQAGDVKAETFIYVDKETNLPLRTESVISSSASVGGQSAVKIVTELTNIQTNVAPKLFEEPAGMSKVDPAQVKAQVETVLKAALFFVQNLMQSGSTSAPAPTTNQSPTK